MNIKKSFYLLIAVLATTLFSFTGCVDKNFDQPPATCAEDMYAPTTTIKDLKAMLGSADTLQIKDSIIISGIVISDDLHGNFYKELTIEDATGGIDILLDASYLYETYPVGKKVFILCKGLYLGKQYGVVKLGGLYLNAGVLTFGRMVGDDFIAAHLQRSCIDTTVVPVATSISTLNDSNLYRLVVLDSVQFDDNATWADGINQTTIEHKIKDKNGDSLIVRTSGFATFAQDSLPKGSGTLVGVLGKYNAVFQFYVRTPNDAQMTNPRF